MEKIRFYTGIPSEKDEPFWNHFWTAKLAQMGTRGIHTFSRTLRYRDQTITLLNGQTQPVRVGQEKGIDVRIALDIVRMARMNQYDVAVILSQDQDLSEAADEVRVIAKEQNRWIKVASAFPVSPMTWNKRGIEKTDWIKIEKSLYDSCLDLRDYRPKKS